MHANRTAVSAGAISILFLGVTVSWGQVVPGFIVEEYATVGGPVEMSFDPTGILYVGHDLSFSGGTSTDPAKIHRVGIGGFPVEEYGLATIGDPDAVLFDVLGVVSGVPGSVLVGGIDFPGSSMGSISAIFPDESIGTIYGPSADFKNVNAMEFDSMGRLIIVDNDGDTTGEVYVADGGAPTLLFTLPADNGSLTLDADDRIYTAAIDGVIRIHDSAGALVDDAFVTGLTLGTSAPMAVGQGGTIWGTDLFAVDRGTGELLRIDSGGSVIVIGTDFGGEDRLAADLAFGPDGALYVSFLDEDRIIRIIPEPLTLTLVAVGLLGLLRRRRQ